MKINEFVAAMSNGIARTNRFSVVMQVPVAMPDSGRTPLRNLLLFCDQAQLPGLSVNAVPIRIFGEVRETPTEYNYEPITLSFYVDAQMHIKAWFDDWIAMLQYGNQRSFRYYDEYICPQMQILVQDTMDQSRYQITLYEVWPKNVGAIQLDYASKDVMKLSVTLQYKYWESITIDSVSQEEGPLTRSLIKQGGELPGLDFESTLDFNETLVDVENDITKIKQIPDEYISNFNSYQQNLQGTINSYRNNVNGELNKLKGIEQNITADFGFDNWI